MKGEEIVIWTLAGIGVVALLWMANQQNQDAPFAADIQTDEDVLGLGVQANAGISAGTPLDMSWEVHGWHPGRDPGLPANQPVYNKHRYPAVPGGNLSTVMHKGWGACIKDAPEGNLWRLNPPEVSVL